MKKRLIAAPLVAILFLLLVIPTPVLSDGAFFKGAFYHDLHQSAQRAVILYGNGTQHLILAVSFEGDAEDFAWVIPVPNLPAINISDPEIFRELSDFTRRAIPPKGGGCSPAPAPGGVDVIEEKVVGPYATAILSAENPSALVDWLNANGYTFPEHGEEIVAEYIEKGWYFVAFRINAVEEVTGQALGEGLIEPIVLSFASDQIVYPLRITSLSATSPQVLLYVFADHIVVPKQYPVFIGYGYWPQNAFSLEFGERVSLRDLSNYDKVAELLSTHLSGDEFYLTTLRGQISADHMVDIELVFWQEGASLRSLAGTNTRSGDIAVLAIVTVPVIVMYFRRRHRQRVADAS